MILDLSFGKVKVLVGQSSGLQKPLKPFDDTVCDFLNSLSGALNQNTEAKKFPDIMTFAFWCRRANIAQLKDKFSDENFRLGLGTAFHIAPSNVPVNFAFSLAFGLLTGNANIVKVSSKPHVQIKIICEVLERVLSQPQFSLIREMNSIVRYDNDDAITQGYSLLADVRLLWGGDQTIAHLKSFETKLRARDIVFSDRFSISIMNPDVIESLSAEEIQRLAEKFYNDTYLMDQNACSSPKWVIWNGGTSEQGKERFWETLGQLVESKYDLQPIFVMDKYFKACIDSVNLGELVSFSGYKNYIYRVKMTKVASFLDELRGSFGYFYEYSSPDLQDVFQNIGNQFQTITYFGLEPKEIAELIVRQRAMGVDRIVPVGEALNIGLIWDGYNLFQSLTRVIDVR